MQVVSELQNLQPGGHGLHLLFDSQNLSAHYIQTSGLVQVWQPGLQLTTSPSILIIPEVSLLQIVAL